MKSHIAAKLDDCWEPRSIAIVGASNSRSSMGTALYLEPIVKFGYKGQIYPVHPKADVVMGYQGYPSLKDIPGDVDYVISSVSANHVPEMLRQCPDKNVKMVHLFTARMAETGDAEGLRLEKEIADEAKRLGIPLLGPNCMGLYNPKERITFSSGFSEQCGPVGGIFQSGSAAVTFIRSCGQKGVGFSKVISYGNAVDINECDLLEYFASDAETKVIVMYVEGVRDGRRFVRTLRQVTALKPVILIKGGRSKAGARSTVSHTGSIAGTSDAWEVIYKQCNVVKATDLNELIDLTTVFALLPPVTGKRVGVFGGSGGKMVMSADECEQAGLDVVPITDEIREYVGQKDPYLRNWIGNPLDGSITGGAQTSMEELFEAFLASPAFDVVIYNVTEEHSLDGEAAAGVVRKASEAVIKVIKGNNKPVAVYIHNPEIGAAAADEWRYRLLFETREKFVANGLPVFATTRGAAMAISKLVNYYRNKTR
ncbi:MAG: acetate--CoA ligase family protein [Bacillota bacterium]